MLTLKWYIRLLSPNNIVSPEFVKDRQVVFLTLVLVPTFRPTVQHILRDKLMMPFSLKHTNIQIPYIILEKSKLLRLWHVYLGSIIIT